jgi:hypothetical protein
VVEVRHSPVRGVGRPITYRVGIESHPVNYGSVGNEDHLGSNPGMLWVQVPPGLLGFTEVFWCHARRKTACDEQGFGRAGSNPAGKVVWIVS